MPFPLVAGRVASRTTGLYRTCALPAAKSREPRRAGFAFRRGGMDLCLANHKQVIRVANRLPAGLSRQGPFVCFVCKDGSRA